MRCVNDDSHGNTLEKTARSCRVILSCKSETYNSVSLLNGLAENFPWESFVTYIDVIRNIFFRIIRSGSRFFISTFRIIIYRIFFEFSSVSAIGSDIENCIPVRRRVRTRRHTKPVAKTLWTGYSFTFHLILQHKPE